MARRNTKLTNRAWRLLRIAILWARKGGIFKQSDFFIHFGLLKTLKLKASHKSNRLYHGEREFSFDETPAFKFKTPSLRFLPCITPEVNNDYDQDEVDLFFYKKDCDNLIEYEYNERHDENVEWIGDREEREEENGIDDKAEEFIRRFYEDMKLQRQKSAIRYYEMLERSV